MIFKIRLIYCKSYIFKYVSKNFFLWTDLEECAILETNENTCCKLEDLKQMTVVTEQETFAWLRRLLILSTINSRSLIEYLWIKMEFSVSINIYIYGAIISFFKVGF